jgi:stage III sporulation protein AG
LEARLEQVLSQIDGAGKVKAMVTLSYGKEIVLSQDQTTDESVSKETDSEGGVREVTSSRIEVKNIIITENGKQKPLIVKEIQPKVEGAIIVAEGGGKAVIKEAIVSSVSAALGIDAHKVHVLKMK